MCPDVDEDHPGPEHSAQHRRDPGLVVPEAKLKSRVVRCGANSELQSIDENDAIVAGEEAFHPPRADTGDFSCEGTVEGTVAVDRRPPLEEGAAERDTCLHGAVFAADGKSPRFLGKAAKTAF